MKWKLRDPSTFPILFGDRTIVAFSKGRAELLEVFRTQDAAKKFCNRFRYWRYCLRNLGHANHRAYQIEIDHRIKLQIVQEEALWAVYVSVSQVDQMLIDKLGLDLPAD